MSATARTRADVDIHANPKLTADILDRYQTNTPVEILEDQTDWFKIRPVRMQAMVAGYVPKEALVFEPKPPEAVFPTVAYTSGSGLQSLETVPPALLLKDFQKWPDSGARPPWIPEEVFSCLSVGQTLAVMDGLLASTQADLASWDHFVSVVTNNQRLGEATMAEWALVANGGKEMYAIRDHYIYTQPSQNVSYVGAAVKGQILHWTGNIGASSENGTRRFFYEVEFFRMSKAMQGWFRADLAGEYLYPQWVDDPDVGTNAQNAFDLSKSLLRFPQDPEIAAAKAAGYTGAQYIDVFGATQRHLRHFSLCGEICVAAILGQDIIPTLKSWLESKYYRAAPILNDAHEGTSLADLQSILKIANLQGEVYSSAPATPQQIKERLKQGQVAISGCGINVLGTVKANGTIRHWVVVEDVLPVGNNGWVRVYNPFNNREEIYQYDLFMTSAGSGAGLWIAAGKSSQ